MTETNLDLSVEPYDELVVILKKTEFQEIITQSFDGRNLVNEEKVEIEERISFDDLEELANKLDPYYSVEERHCEQCGEKESIVISKK